MLTLGSSDELWGSAGTVTAITATGFGDDRVVAPGTPGDNFKVLFQVVLTLTGSEVSLCNPAANHQALIKLINLANTTGTAVDNVRLFVNGSLDGNRITGSFTIPANGWATCDDNGWKVYDQNGAIQ